VADTATFKFRLGDQVKDRVTGFKGVIMARTQWMNLCIRYSVQARDLQDGKPVPDQWFDENDIELVRGSKNLAPEVARATGGPTSSTPRATGH
jgi:hypothetical protein